MQLNKTRQDFIWTQNQRNKIWTQWLNAKKLKGLKGYIVIVISSKTSLVTFLFIFN